MPSMNRLLSALAVLAATQSAHVLALSPTHYECQSVKASGVSPLKGCPAGTIYVSASDTTYANYSTVQAAINSLPSTGAATILIGAGEYFERINVTRSAPLTLLGQLNPGIELSSTANATVTNAATIWYTGHIGQAGVNDDADTSVFTVAPNYAGALIGSGTTGAPLQPEFGNVDFKAYNLNIENRAANYAISQALATDISYANASFYGCTFSSFQDTWYTGRNGSTYVVDSIIFGQTDFLFGFGTAWFQNTTLALRACGGGIVAWKGTNTTGTPSNTTPVAPGNHYGAYIADGSIIRSPDANASVDITEACWLGRPWNDWAVTVYLRNYIENVIQPKGFEPFDSARPTLVNTTYYAESGNYGPGSNTSERESLDHILTAAQASEFTVATVFGGVPSWIDHMEEGKMHEYYSRGGKINVSLVTLIVQSIVYLCMCRTKNSSLSLCTFIRSRERM